MGTRIVWSHSLNNKFCKDTVNTMIQEHVKRYQQFFLNCFYMIYFNNNKPSMVNYKTKSTMFQSLLQSEPTKMESCFVPCCILLTHRKTSRASWEKKSQHSDYHNIAIRCSNIDIVGWKKISQNISVPLQPQGSTKRCSYISDFLLAQTMRLAQTWAWAWSCCVSISSLVQFLSSFVLFITIHHHSQRQRKMLKPMKTLYHNSYKCNFFLHASNVIIFSKPHQLYKQQNRLFSGSPFEVHCT